MIQFAVYGKGGIGKSTIISNLSVLYSQFGKKVLQVGCDPKSDSTHLLLNGRKITTIMDRFLQSGKDIGYDDLMVKSEYGVYCAESGGPEPGNGCAGRGVIKAFEIINSMVDTSLIDIVNYDVLGDVVCGGFAMPIHRGYAENVVIVVSGEMMSIFAANNILLTIDKYQNNTGVKLKGIVLNSRNVPHEVSIVEDFCDATNCTLLGVVPRAKEFSYCDVHNKIMVYSFSGCSAANSLRSIAQKILLNEFSAFKPLNKDRYSEFAENMKKKYWTDSSLLAEV